MGETKGSTVAITGEREKVERLYREIQAGLACDISNTALLLKKGTITHEDCSITGECAEAATDQMWRNVSDEFDVNVEIVRHYSETEKNGVEDWTR